MASSAGRAWDIASPAQITEAQRLLVRLGFSAGAADGKMNTRTAEAIRQFERNNDLPVTGEASVSLLRQLRAATLNTRLNSPIGNWTPELLSLRPSFRRAFLARRTAEC
jgi:peptidoglycan hydrolase-like protein with peptidoglycan-binding domain